ncbi:MAG: hypothetical protein B7Z78_00170 [Rhodospirillales bacterium 20-60-12]|nr:MAG: hypothetical protein B7Z78_00170 [Rhodospirillales bacterium 20-60-12]HQT66486.1 glycosyltransferase [Acetobacteraceae bacterium]
MTSPGRSIVKPAELAAAAWTAGLQEMAAQNYSTAIAWLERVRRLARDDPRPRLDLALAYRAAGRGAAEAEFQALATTYNLAAAWLGIVSCRHQTGDHAGAAAALGHLLARSIMPADASFAQTATMLAEASGAPGWCGITAGGQLRISATATPQITADGRKLTLTKARGGLYDLPPSARTARLLSVTCAGASLLGSPLDMLALHRIDGIVAADQGGISGWAAWPACASAKPELYLKDAKGRTRRIDLGAELPVDLAQPFATRYAFALDQASLHGLTAPLHVMGADQRPLMGSPLDPQAEIKAAYAIAASVNRKAARIPSRAAIPADIIGPPPAKTPKRAKLAVIVPVYRGLATTIACLQALFAAREGADIIIIDDGSPEPSLSRHVAEYAAIQGVTLIRNRQNRGFPAAVNAGLAAAARLPGKRDVLLLNSDTLLPPGALGRLTDAAYRTPATGTVTALSNDATILSYPDPTGGNPAPDLPGTIALDRLAAKTNRQLSIEIPTAIGFCMVIRHDCLAATGLFRTDVFAQGYGEENDFCIRARHLGYRHMAAMDVFVAHHGSVSFGLAGRALAARNIDILNRLHPGYDQLIADFIAADPLAAARRKLDEARLRRAAQGKRSVLLISHDHGGGVARIIAERMARYRDDGLLPVLIGPSFPDEAMFERGYGLSRISTKPQADYPNLTYDLPREAPALHALLRRLKPDHAQLHHSLGQHPSIRDLAHELGIAQDIVVHDYAAFCPRVNLIGAGRRYCGEPAIAQCTICVADEGNEIAEAISPADLRARSAGEFARARRIAVPSADAAKRLARHFPSLSAIQLDVTPWENDELDFSLRPPPGPRAPRRIAVIGGIGPAKGYDVLRDCARDAASRNLPLSFVLIGASEDDQRLIDTGRVFITGAYQEGEAAGLLRQHQADLCFLPSIWPETWCFTLSEAWRGGCYVIGFDLGAPAARLAATQRGHLLPLGLPTARINDILLAWQPDLRNLNQTPLPSKSVNILRPHLTNQTRESSNGQI